MKQLEPSVRERVESWLVPSYDPETRAEIERLLASGNHEELTDAFYRDLEFGTGGMRGLMGVGSNRMNRYTVARATQGFCNYLRKTYPDEPIRVAIARDNRNNAEAFSSVVADVFSANGISVFMFRELRPTPELSWVIRKLDCHGGVMLTASHNPKEYSGFKAYWCDGGQLIPPHDKGVMEEVQRIAGIDEINFSADPGLISYLGEEQDRGYIGALLANLTDPEAIAACNGLPMVYSPIHGSGVKLVPEVLRAAGFTELHLVEEQCSTDGNFPTVIYPNPEEREALTMAIDRAEALGAELVMATDPDADRVGIVVRNERGELELLNGNQTAALLFDYILRREKERGRLAGDEMVVKTIVTSYLLDRIAGSYGVSCYNVLTGFKYIGELMTRLEGEKRFLVGGEESYGYLIGDHVRDKDAVVSCLMIAEMAAHYKSRGQSLFEALKAICHRHGFYRERLISVTRKGRKGAEEIRDRMEGYRNDPPPAFAGSQVVRIKDYRSQQEYAPDGGNRHPIGLPVSNVLQFETEAGDLISVRPSGTEPKIKFYISVQASLENPEQYRQVESTLERRLDRIAGELAFS